MSGPPVPACSRPKHRWIYSGELSRREKLVAVHACQHCFWHKYESLTNTQIQYRNEAGQEFGPWAS